MSRAYPLARALPVLFTPAIALALGRGESLSPLAIAGMAFVFTGCVLLPLDRLASLRPAAYLNVAVGMAFIAAIGTTGYSLTDARAITTIRDAWTDSAAIEVALVYLWWLSLSTVVWLLPLCLLSAPARRELRSVTRPVLINAGLMGIGIHLAYMLVLAAMTFARDVSYVVAFRQTSIPLGTLAGVLVLGEPASPLKFVGSIVVFIGLIFVGIG
jgi:drug/metabolite transporter (DMT)-like permease